MPVPMFGLAVGEWHAPSGLECRRSAEASRARVGGFVFGSQPDVKGSKHGDVDAKASEHQLDGAEHKGREGRSRKVADEVDNEDLPEAHDADDNAAIETRQRGWRALLCPEYSRGAKGKTRDDCQLLSLAHVQLPDRSDR